MQPTNPFGWTTQNVPAPPPALSLLGAGDHDGSHDDCLQCGIAREFAETKVSR